MPSDIEIPQDTFRLLVLLQSWCTSSTHNRRQLEHPWYMYWTQALTDFLSCTPAFPAKLFVTPHFPISPQEQRRGTRFPDFVMASLVGTVPGDVRRPRAADNEGFTYGRLYRRLQKGISDELLEDLFLILEIKRLPVVKHFRRSKNLTMIFKPGLKSARSQAEEQAALLFAQKPLVTRVILVAAVGHVWSWGIAKKPSTSPPDPEHILLTSGDPEWHPRDSDDSDGSEVPPVGSKRQRRPSNPSNSQRRDDARRSRKIARREEDIAECEEGPSSSVDTGVDPIECVSCYISTFK